MSILTNLLVRLAVAALMIPALFIAIPYWVISDRLAGRSLELYPKNEP